MDLSGNWVTSDDDNVDDDDNDADYAGAEDAEDAVDDDDNDADDAGADDADKEILSKYLRTIKPAIGEPEGKFGHQGQVINNQDHCQHIHHDHYDYDGDNTNESSDTPDKGESAKGGGEQVDAEDLNKGRGGDRTPGDLWSSSWYENFLIKFMIRIFLIKSW